MCLECQAGLRLRLPRPRAPFHTIVMLVIVLVHFILLQQTTAEYIIYSEQKFIWLTVLGDWEVQGCGATSDEGFLPAS